MTLGKISDKDMGHGHFLKSTCDIGGSPIKGPSGVQEVCPHCRNVSEVMALNTEGSTVDKP